MLFVGILGFTILIQFVATGSIAYEKWKIWQEERRNRVVSLQMQSQDQMEAPQSQQVPVGIHNQAYNDVLVELSHLLILLIFIIIGFISKTSKHTVEQTDLIGISRALLYFYDFGATHLLSLIFPICFYVTHPDVKTFLTGLLC